MSNIMIIISNEYSYRRACKYNIEQHEAIEDIILNAMKQYHNYILPLNKNIIAIYTVTPTYNYEGHWHIFIENNNTYIETTSNIYSYFDLNIIESMLQKYIGRQYEIADSIFNINRVFEDYSTYNIYKFNLDEDMYYLDTVAATFHSFTK